MILLVRLNDKSIKKVYLKERIFHEVNADNKKMEQIKSSTVRTIFWIKDGKMNALPKEEVFEEIDSLE